MANNISIHMIIIFNNWEESWKYEAQQSIFDELRGVSSGDETVCQMLDITSQTKWFYKEKLRHFFIWFPNTIKL